MTPPAGVMWPPLAAGTTGADRQGAGPVDAPAAPAQDNAAGKTQTPPAPVQKQTPRNVSELMEQATVLVLALREEGLSMA